MVVSLCTLLSTATCLYARAAVTASALEATIHTPGSPFASVSSADGRFLFISVSGPKRGVAVYRRNGQAFAQFNFVHVASAGAFGLALSPDGRTLLVADGDGIGIIDAGEAEARGRQTPLQVADGVHPGTIEVVITSDSKYAFASDENSASISVVRLAKRADGRVGGIRVGAIRVDSTPVGLAVSPDDRFLYVTSEIASLSTRAAGDGDPRLSRSNCTQGSYSAAMPNGVVTVIDASRAENEQSDSVVSRVASGCSPVRIVLARDGDTAWVTVRGDNRIFAFDTKMLQANPARALVASVAVGPAPVGLALLVDGAFLVVASSNRFSHGVPSDIWLLRLRPTPGVVSRVPAGTFPRELSVSVDGATLFLTNFDSGNVMVFDVGKLIAGEPPA